MRDPRPAGTGSRTRLAAVSALLLLSACSETTRDAGEAADDRPVRGGTLVIAGPGDLTEMNGFVANEAYTTDFLQHALFLPLVRLGMNNEYLPALAESWE